MGKELTQILSFMVISVTKLKKLMLANTHQTALAIIHVCLYNHDYSYETLVIGDCLYACN